MRCSKVDVVIRAILLIIIVPNPNHGKLTRLQCKVVGVDNLSDHRCFGESRVILFQVARYQVDDIGELMVQFPLVDRGSYTVTVAVKQAIVRQVDRRITAIVYFNVLIKITGVTKVFRIFRLWHYLSDDHIHFFRVSCC